MTEDTLLPFDLPAVHRKKLTVDFEGGNQSSDAGLLLLLREAERKLGVPAACGSDAGSPRSGPVRHAMFEMVMALDHIPECRAEINWTSILPFE
jgi:hypothetical protein